MHLSPASLAFAFSTLKQAAINWKLKHEHKKNFKIFKFVSYRFFKVPRGFFFAFLNFPNILGILHSLEYLASLEYFMDSCNVAILYSFRY